MRILICSTKYSPRSKKEYTYNMGAIQNSINQMAGSVAGAAFGLSHVKNQELAAAEQASLKAPETKEAIEGLEGDIAKAELDLTNKKTELAGISPDTTDPMERIKATGLASDIAASEKALGILNEKLVARQAMLGRIEKTMHRADRWSLGGNK